MHSTKSFIVTAVSALALAACGGSGGSASGARDQVKAVGSSTVYPFATAVAEGYAKSSGEKSPTRLHSPDW